MRFHSAACAVVLSAAATSAFSFSPLAVPPATSSVRNNGIAGRSFAPTSGARPAFGLPSSSNNHLSIISSTTTPSSSSSSTTSLNLAGGGGPEALEDYIATLSHTESKLSSKLRNPRLVKLAGVAALPLSYVVGAAVTPSRRLAARAVVGAFAAVTAGGVGKDAVDEDVRRSCPAAIARRLFELGVDDANVADGIYDLKEDHGVDDEDFANMRTEVYAVYLAGMAMNPLAKTAELKELASLKLALDLDNMQVGQAHADAAAKFYRDVTRFTSLDELDDEDHPDRVSLDKLLFLTERAFRQGGETEEAFTFEFSRVARALGGLTIAEGLQRAKDVAKPFYERALASTRAKLNSGAVSPDMLGRARGTLGIDEVEAKEMHIEAFDKEIRIQLGLPEEDDDDDDMDDYNEFQDKRVETVGEVKKKLEAMKEVEAGKAIEDTSAIKFADGAYDTLSKLQGVLELSDEDADYEISAATTDYWRNTVLATLDDAIAGTKTPAKAWEIINARQKELYLKDSAVREMMTSMVMQALGRPLEKVNAFARVNNAAATYDGLVDAIAAKETCKEVLKEAGWSEFEDFEKACFDPYDKASACGFLTNQDRHSMYQIFFNRSVKADEDGTKNISDESYALLKELRGMLGLSEDEGVAQVRNYFGPELQGVLTMATDEILRGNANDALLENLQEKVDKVINDFKLDAEMVYSYAGPLYARAVSEIGASTPGGIPSTEEVATLASLRELLKIDVEETYDVNLQTFGAAYKKGIKEALGTTGVITEEYRKPLEDLRSRLGVSEKAAKDVYLEAIGERMVPMVQFISNEMERLVLTQEQLSQKRGVDFGEDYFKGGGKASGKLGMGTDGNIMSDIMNLIDFYVENDIVQKEAVGTKKVERKVPSDEEGGEEKTITEEEPVYESTYPITAMGLECIDSQVAELCYRQFVVSSFTDQSPNAARYEASKATWGGILGLTNEKMEEIGSNIGSMVYDNYITQSMSTKGALDQQDMMFLANIQGKLGISAEDGERMLLDTQKKIISEEASAMFDSGEVSPENIKAFREKCNSMGLDLEGDVGITKSRLITMFQLEITPGIDSGEITIESADMLAEIQESLGLTEEEGEEVVAGLITDRANGILADIIGCMMRGKDVMSVESMEKLVQYAAFVDGDLGLQVEEANANRAYNLFESKDWSGVDEADVERQKELLKIAFGMSS
eukprot:CAMPEP_0181123232 /NCGR_PEP_ID=MMETSP1071-20121207/25776_1 /TAXON_ID=35127 /ORGANISM="Thalassiosira sp., Strain NH16" /LENGTH=1197 /DNA_ID=CAMNT_0023208333 /DNA_START=215 /DNA_END=3808 /DNA_ORIENTATION=-